MKATGGGAISAAFVTSAAEAKGFPKESLPELAMVGRSNVGKSSLINALVRQTLARTSAAPGKTRLANFYRVQAGGKPPFFLVDLPGYGYARGGDAGPGGLRPAGRGLLLGRPRRHAAAGGQPPSGAGRRHRGRGPGWSITAWTVTSSPRRWTS